MTRTTIAIAAGLCLAFAAVPAWAQNTGYGGQTKAQAANQMTIDQFFGLAPMKKKPVKRHAARHRKAPLLETGSTEKTAETSASVSCKKFDSTVGQTITVPCR